jgi:glycosyltransferase involved in cell wall biosynthesis
MPDIFLVEEDLDRLKVTYLDSIQEDFIVSLEDSSGESKIRLKSTFYCFNHWRFFNLNFAGSSRLVIYRESDLSPLKSHDLSTEFTERNGKEITQEEIKVSVIIPCYNFGDYIEHCVYSVLSQITNFKYEILIGDDYSNDSSESILKRLSKYNNNIRYFRYNKNLGGRKNVKFLIDNCVGEYIAYIDGDDFWTNNTKLQKQVDFLENNPEYSMCFTGHWRYDKNGKSFPDESWFGYSSETPDIDSDRLLAGNPIASLTKVFRNYEGDNWNDFLNTIPLFDWGHNFFLSKKGLIRYLNFPSAVYRLHGQGVFTSLTHDKIVEKNEQTIKFLKEYE